MARQLDAAHVEQHRERLRPAAVAVPVEQPHQRLLQLPHPRLRHLALRATTAAAAADTTAATRRRRRLTLRPLRLAEHTPHAH